MNRTKPSGVEFSLASGGWALATMNRGHGIKLQGEYAVQPAKLVESGPKNANLPFSHWDILTTRRM